DTDLNQLLSLPAPSPALSPTDIRNFVGRWNRTVDYARRDIFTVAEVPAGESTDFIAADVQIGLSKAAVAANDAAIADGYADAFDAVFKASQELLSKANRAG